MRIIIACVASRCYIVRMNTTQLVKPVRKPTNLSIDSSLLADAKLLGINISRSAEEGIAEAVREARKSAWLKNNRDALKSSNQFVNKQGLPLEDQRQF